MNILSLWGESLRVLHPSHARLFILVTLNSARRALFSMLTLYWWLYLLAAGLMLGIPWVPVSKLCALGIHAVVFILTIIALRPSLEAKDKNYFYTYFFSRNTAVVGAILCGWYGLAYASLLMLYFCGSALGVWWLAASAWFIISIFFLCAQVQASLMVFDYQASWCSLYRSVVRGLRMALYGLPMMLVLGIFGLWAYRLISFSLPGCTLIEQSMIGRGFIFAFHELAKIIFLASMTTYHLKLKYEHYDFFFDTPTSRGK